MMLVDVDDIADKLRIGLVGVVYSNEYDLQEAIAHILEPDYDHELGMHNHHRELKLSDGKSRIDFFIETDRAWPEIPDSNSGIGIEVKINGSLSSVIRQLDRYAACTEIDELILITTRSKHHHIPRIIGARGIRVHLVSLLESGL